MSLFMFHDTGRSLVKTAQFEKCTYFALNDYADLKKLIKKVGEEPFSVIEKDSVDYYCQCGDFYCFYFEKITKKWLPILDRHLREDIEEKAEYEEEKKEERRMKRSKKK